MQTSRHQGLIVSAMIAKPLSTFARVVLPLLVVTCVMFFTTEVMACPTCKDGLAENDPASAAQAAGYFYSILFMMAMPFVILGTFGGAAYVSIRRAREEQATSGLEAGQ